MYRDINIGYLTEFSANRVGTRPVRGSPEKSSAARSHSAITTVGMLSLYSSKIQRLAIRAKVGTKDPRFKIYPAKSFDGGDKNGLAELKLFAETRSYNKMVLGCTSKIQEQNGSRMDKSMGHHRKEFLPPILLYPL